MSGCSVHRLLEARSRAPFQALRLQQANAKLRAHNTAPCQLVSVLFVAVPSLPSVIAECLAKLGQVRPVLALPLA